MKAKKVASLALKHKVVGAVVGVAALAGVAYAAIRIKNCIDDYDDLDFDDYDDDDDDFFEDEEIEEDLGNEEEDDEEKVSKALDE